jgi:small ubiquitin-related modifier
MADAPKDGAGAEHLQLKGKDQHGAEVQFKIKKATPLRKLMDAYCQRLGMNSTQVRFMVDGERISADDTAEKLGLEDEDLIDVAVEQTGGC